MNGKLVTAILGLALVAHANGHEMLDLGSDEMRMTSTAELLRSKGYWAKDYYLGVQDDKYTINLVRAKFSARPSPYGRDSGPKEPILFIHGLFSNANIFMLTDKYRTSPKDFRNRTINRTTERDLYKLIADDPGSQSLVFTALNFGHEVWLLNRRPTRASQMAQLRKLQLNKPKQGRGKLGSEARGWSPQEVEYWNFSLDEQAIHDLPASIEFVLYTTGANKLITVGHSAGSALTLMALANQPKLSNKISKAILWAPIFDLPYGYKPAEEFLPQLDLISRLSASYPLSGTIKDIMIDIQRNCSYPPENLTGLCESTMDSFMGNGSHQLEKSRLIVKNNWLDYGSIRELVQFLQTIKKKQMHRFDFIDQQTNMEVYGAASPPVWDISKITAKRMSFWIGNTDIVSSEENFSATKKRLKVPHESYVLHPEHRFNHFGFILHKNITELLVVPNMMIIASR